MTLDARARITPLFAGDGVTVTFPFSFKVFNKTELAFIVTAATGAQTVKVLDLDFSVLLYPDQESTPGGAVTYPISGSPLPIGESAVVAGVLPITQPADLPSGGSYRAGVIENALDRTVMLIQERADQIAGALRVPETTQLPTFPVASARADKLAGFDSSGNPVAVAPASGSAAALATNLASAAVGQGSRLVAFIQRLAGSAARWLENKASEIVTPEDFDAVGDGAADDSAAFLAAYAVTNRVAGRANSTYKIKNITLSNAQHFDARGATLKAAAGASFLFKLTGFASRVSNFYVSDGLGCSQAAFVFDNGRFCEVLDGTITNTTTALKLQATVAATGCIKPRISRIHVETYSGKGIDLGPNVLQLAASDVFLDGGGGGATHGVNHVSTGSVIAYGGHTYDNVRAEGVAAGWVLADATLVEINGGWADTCSGIGFRATGACDHINVRNFFVGTCTGGGVSVENTSVVYFDGLETFAAADSVKVLNTAKLFMNLNGWRGSKAGFSVASGAVFTATGGGRFVAGSVGNVPVSTTTYLGQNSVQAAEADTVWRAPDDGYLLGIYAVCGVTPVTSHVYTARVNAADVALVATVAPAGFSAAAHGAVSVTRGQSIDVKLATSTTNASRHSAELIFVAN
jgi:hypothetical protein